jgi:hypothetical protein
VALAAAVGREAVIQLKSAKVLEEAAFATPAI